MSSFPVLPLPGNYLLAHSLLFLAAVALVVGVALAGILVGHVLSWGVNRVRQALKGR